MIVVLPFVGQGGVRRRLNLWTKYLSAEYNLVLVLGGADETTIQTLKQYGATVYELAWHPDRSKHYMINNLSLLNRWVEIIEPDIVVSMFFYSITLTSMVCLFQKFFRFREIPHIVHVAGLALYYLHVRSGLGCLSKMLHGLHYLQPDKIITICENNARILHRDMKVSSKKLVTIPIGIEIGTATPGKPKNHIVFGIVSRLSREKQPLKILDIFERVWKIADRKPYLYVYGDGPLSEEMKTTVKNKGLTDYIIFWGWVRDPGKAFETIDCLLLYSDNEGTPRAILEAAEHFVPAVARDTGGVGETMIDGQTGYIINDSDGMKEKMLYLIDHPEQLPQFGKKARQYIEHKYAIGREIRQLRKLFNHFGVE